MPLIRNAIIKQFNPLSRRLLQCCSSYGLKPKLRFKSDKPPLSSLVVPIELKVCNNPDDINIGAEITGEKLTKENILKVLNEIIKRQPFKQLAAANGIDNDLFQQCFESFRNYCLKSKILPTELHVKLSDIRNGYGNVDDLFPDFLKHSKQVFPHLECLEELKAISDLTSPVNWYPEARNLQRKIIFHCGPTNSGKTYHALKRFIEAESGIYCAPLRLLAVEVNKKANASGTKCDLVTGEERLLANEDGTQASHVACTVEMACTKTPREVAVVDEIQMLRDEQRGWAWTRALLGLPAQEIHLCGEEAALDLIREMLAPIFEDVEVHRYKRLTPLVIEDRSLGSLEKVKKGDCIVCFNKKDIFNVSLQLDKLGHDVAVIYGSLPPGTKISQTHKFNDPNDECNLLVATDAIGMGLNLSINRVIFYSLKKVTMNEKGETTLETISTSAALQIAGRAGRFNTEYSTGYVTTFAAQDLPILRDLLSRPVDPISAAGLHPTMEQIEMFAYHLPKATFSNLFDIFLSICKMDSSSYFMCNVDTIKYLADLIQHVPLPLKVRYVFCHAPINLKIPFICTMFLKFARQFSQNEPVTVDWMFRVMEWPFSVPMNIAQLVHLEAAFDVLDLYLWLGFRFPDLFPDAELIRDMQKELDVLIHKGVLHITKLLKTDSRASRSIQIKDDCKEATFVDTNVPKTEEDISETYKKGNFSEGSVTEQLLNSGIITPKVLKKLHSEWLKSHPTNENPTKEETWKKGKPRRRKD